MYEIRLHNSKPHEWSGKLLCTGLRHASLKLSLVEHEAYHASLGLHIKQ